MHTVFNALLSLILIVIFAGCGSAAQNLQTKANNGEPKSQVELAGLYYTGSKDVKQDKEMAMKLYTLAAQDGNVDALYSLGYIAEKNNEYEKAASYYQKAADKEHTYAQINLGLLYKHGRGVPQDSQEAERLFTKAYQNGDILGLKNLAILYKDSTKQNDKATKAFKELIFSIPHDKDNPIILKKAYCVQLMNINYAENLWEDAYIWGAVAIISGLFDEKIEEPEKHLKTFEVIKSKLSKEKQQTLAKEIHYNYYNAFQKYMYYYKANPSLKADDGISLETNKQLIALTGYMAMMNKELYGQINYFKSKSDEISKINYAIANLRLAQSHIEYGSISSYYYSAIGEINESLEILNQYNYPNLGYMKDATAKKLEILQDVYVYYNAQYEIKRKEK